MRLPERLQSAWLRARETARRMIGVPDYETYVAHRRANHPDQPIMTYVEFFRERQQARRAILDDLEIDRVEIGTSLLPVILVLHQLDRLAAPELDELEWTGTDRLGPHVALGGVAGVDR